MVGCLNVDYGGGFYIISHISLSHDFKIKIRTNLDVVKIVSDTKRDLYMNREIVFFHLHIHAPIN